MVPTAQEDRASIDPLLQEIPWSYAARILETAATCARRDGLYPVLVTSFKCSPDSFIVDYFTKILDAFDKPYLILQLDDHDSSVGYETRIEAALRAFANHHRRHHVEITRHEDTAPPAARTAAEATGSGRAGGSETEPVGSGKTAPVAGETPAVGPVLSPSMEGKTVLFPNWDSLTNRLIVAGLRSRGVDARLLHEDQLTIQRSMRTNSGQCIPVNVIAEESLSYVQSEGLDPEQTVLWMPRSKWACNIPLYPHYIKSVFDAAKVPIGVYSGDFTLKDVSLGATYDAYFGYLFGGMLRRIGCMIRPYETNPGETNRVLSRSIAYLEDTFASRQSKADAWEEVIGQLMAIERRPGPRKPQVAIFGDLYTRDNDTANQNLVESIEEAGGEVVTTPYSEYVKVIATAHFKKLFRQRELLQWGTLRAVHAVLTNVERRFYRPLSDLMPEGPLDTNEQNIEEELAKFNMRSEQTGESVENVLKIFHILRHHPDVSLFVQASPAFCCPSLITESMASRIQDLTGVPVVSVTYDGTGAYQNEIIVPYLKLAG
jgi:predicted nucleotide-binding protein (sugar kinase/HSP70/actin superfamily)